MQWKILQSTRNYDGHFKVDELVVQHELFAGGMSEKLVRERVTRKNAVAVLPYDPIRDELVLIEQFRVGALGHKDSAKNENPWLMEIVAGLVEEGESNEEVVYREALEEANCKIEKLHFVTSFYPSPGGFAEVSHVYIGKVDAANLGGLSGLDEEDEDIRVHVVSSAHATEMLKQGKICSAIPMIAMYNFLLLRDTLQEQWST